MQRILEAYLNGQYAAFFIGMLRYLMPVLGALILLRCAKPLMTFRREPEIWAWLNMKDGTQYPITHWESVIGRSKNSDVRVQVSTVSRNHAVLTRYDDGSWTIRDIGSKDGVYVNGKQVEICALSEKDKISVGGVEMHLQTITKRQEQHLAELRTKGSSTWGAAANLTLLTVFQILMVLGFLVECPQEAVPSILIGFGGILLCQWLLFGFYASIRRSSLELETLAFLLSTMGMAAIVAVKPGESLKQLVAMVLGLMVFLLIGWSLRDLERAKKVRYLAVAAGVGFLLITLIFGKEQYGARNWLNIGGVSLQPSELTKVCFVFAGASTLDRIMTKRNLVLFISYSAVICVCLALMNDFGTALVFFCAFLVIAYLRSGSVGTVALAITALCFAGVLAIKVAPHALKRFASWGHIWEDPTGGGYQQTKALMCIASGGLFGLGPDRGWLHRVFAADSDIVFATISEEWGLILATLMVLAVAVYDLFAVRTAKMARSSFYSIGACTAASILTIQTILNVMGTLDILPFTGVTFPFLSNGGTSMIGAWGLLAFVKAADTRQNASFAVIMNEGGEQDNA